MDTIIDNTNGKTVVTLKGRLDTTNAIAFEEKMKPIMEDQSPQVVLECSEFNYISSSGLRIFLTIQKRVMANGGQLVIRNIRPEIREVFDMTGFSAIFTIE